MPKMKVPCSSLPNSVTIDTDKQSAIFPVDNSKPNTPVNNGGYRDNKAPACLTLTIKDSEGNVWGVMAMDSKAFSTGSVGFYGNGKIVNPANPSARYQAGFNLTLVGSKPAV